MSPGSSQPLRVLFVEDAFDQALLVKAILQSHGNYVVSHSQDGDHAAKLLEEETWDLLITDLNLPGLDGFELCRLAKANHPGLPVLAVTGYTGAHYQEQAFRAGASELLTKPLERNIPDACFHVEQGYIYFRRKGDRLLIGGARNRDLETEQTAELGPNTGLIDFLRSFAVKLTGSPVEIEEKWSGIIGVGPEKGPIVKRLDQQKVLAVRLSGMGVALGSAIGREAARLILNNE